MGLDAFVPCNCFEKGLLSKPPEPFQKEDVYRDEDGYIASRTLDRHRRELGYDAFRSRYGRLDDLFEEWADHACEHEYGEYFAERVSNWAGTRRFESVVEELGGASRYPALSRLIPEANGGAYPAELAPQAIEEIDDLMERAKELMFNVLVCADSDEPIWTCADCGRYPMMMGPYIEMGMDGGDVYFVYEGRRLTSRRFRQDPVGQPDFDGAQPMDVTLSETGEHVRVFDSIGPRDAPAVSREFWVERREAPFLYEGHYYTAERIRSLLVASAEMGTPICWC